MKKYPLVSNPASSHKCYSSVSVLHASVTEKNRHHHIIVIIIIIIQPHQHSPMGRKLGSKNKRQKQAVTSSKKRGGKKTSPSKRLPSSSSASTKTSTSSSSSSVSLTYSSDVIGLSHARKQKRKRSNADSDDEGDSSSDEDFDVNLDLADYGELDPAEQAMKESLEEQLFHSTVAESLDKKATQEQREDAEQKIASLNHEQIRSTMKQTETDWRAANGAAFQERAKDRTLLLLSCLKDSSRAQYDSNKRRVEKAGFEWSTEGLYHYFTSGAVAAKVGNSSCYSTLSTFKLFFSAENDGRRIPADEENLLRLTLRARKNHCPDLPRIVGAITRERLEQLHQLYKTKRSIGELSEEDYQELLDVSNMLYACALRIFQNRSLTASSFVFSDTNEKIAWVTVPAKCTSNSRFSESKVVHPDFIPIIKDIIRRRGSDNTLLFPKWARAEEGTSDTSRLRMEKLMKDCNQDAANLCGWPAVTSFHGTHNFRHGAAQDAFAEGGVQLVMMRTGHLSEQCANYYARSDLERSRRSAFAAMKPDTQRNEIKNFLDKVKKNVNDMRLSADLTPLAKYAEEQENNLSSDANFVPLFHPGKLEEQQRRIIIETREKQAAAIQETRVMRTSRRRGRVQQQNEPKIDHRQPPAPEYCLWDLNDLK